MATDAKTAHKPEDARAIWARCRPPLSSSDWQTRKRAVQELAQSGHGEALLGDLLSGVRDETDANLRNSALEVLTTMGARIVPFLVGQLSNADLETQKFLIDVLGAVGSPYAAPRLATLLSHYDQNIRFASAEALGKIAVPLSAEALLGHLAQTYDGTERFILLQALANSLRNGVPADLSIDALRSLRGDPLLTRALLELLRIFDSDEAYVFLWQWLEEFDEFRWQEAAKFLGKLAPERLAAMTARLGPPRIQIGSETLTQSFTRSLDDDIRTGALWLAAWSGHYEALFAAFNRGYGDFRHLTKALACLPADKLQPVFADVEALDNERQRLAIELIGDKKLTGRIDLMLKLANRDPSLRSLAFRCCCELGHTDALEWLPELLRDPDAVEFIASGLQILLPEHRQRVLDVLAPWSDSIMASTDWQTFLLLVERLNLVSVRNRVEQAWKRADPEVRAAALPVMARFKLEFARHYLSMALIDDNVGVRLAAAEILSDVATEENSREIRTLLVDRDAWIRALGVRTLARLLGPKAENELTAKLSDRGAAVRIEALRCLHNLHLDRHATAVRSLLARETDPDVTCESIRYLRGANQEPIDADLTWLKHAHWRIRFEAMQWLGGYQRHQDSVDRAIASEEDVDVRALLGSRVS